MGFLSNVFKGVTKLAKGATKFLSGGLGGSLLSAGLDMFGANKQNEANSAQALRQMDFQERMRNTSYQASMADMKKAGLNPMLAYSNGGAAVPSGASAQMQNELSGATGKALDYVNSAVSRKMQKTQTDKAWEEMVLATERVNTERENQRLIAENAKLAEEQARKTAMQANAAKMANDVYKAGMDAWKKEGKIRSDNPWLQYIKVFGGAADEIMGTANSALSLGFRGKALTGGK